jgi:hypothetical protein
MIETQSTPTQYFDEIGAQRLAPVIHIERDKLAAALEPYGAKGISVPDPFEPFQIRMELYVGATTPEATTEVPHIHNVQTEAYVIITGQAEILAKHRWIDDGWATWAGNPGDVLLIPPEVCHWFRWCSSDGLALVFKAPQRAGVGRFPAGKVVCKYCPHYGRGCVLPDGFTPST